ncbi:MAG: biotin--[acetyl-CoA-carboxylase] ligase [Pseudomonadota bacterium]
MGTALTAWPENYGRIVLAEVGSTSDAAKRLAADHAAPFWVLAHRQTAPRGRRGRAWITPEGNLAATLVLHVNEPPAQVALRSFVMSLALFRAFGKVTGQPGLFSLKWPNDVLLNNGKVAGILLESASLRQQSTLLTIGVGVNLVAAPSSNDVETTAVRPVSLASETDVHCAAEDFLDSLAWHYAQLETQFQDHGFAPIRTGWLAHAARLGETITARTGTETTIGIFEDVDAQGHLVLRGPRGAAKIAAADVFF